MGRGYNFATQSWYGVTQNFENFRFSYDLFRLAADSSVNSHCGITTLQCMILLEFNCQLPLSWVRLCVCHFVGVSVCVSLRGCVCVCVTSWVRLCCCRRCCSWWWCCVCRACRC